MRKIEFDILGRTIYQTEPVTGTVYEYEYTPGNSRIVILKNDLNTSNFKTIRKQTLINDKYIDTEVFEFGETYNTIKKYKENKEIYFEQINVKTGKVYKKKTIWKDGTIHIWMTEYNGNRNVGFYMSKDNINKLIN